MTAFQLFGLKKKRKYPIKRDETGKSARSRCFEMFADNIPYDEIAEIVGVKVDTVRRYHQQCKNDPGFERRFTLAQSLFKKTAPERESNIEIFARVLGISKEQFETIPCQPHGLRRLMTNKIYLPIHAAADRKRHMALELALLITEHLINNKGKFEDVYFPLKRLMQENMKYCEEDDAYIKAENEWITFVRAIFAADMKNEQQSRVKEERLTEEERAIAIKLGIEAKNKRYEKRYWMHIGELMSEGCTQEQAREKIYQDLINKGDIEGAKMMHAYQDKVHPLKKSSDQTPPPAPLAPPLPSLRPLRETCQIINKPSV
jgi:hypothetical protein